MPIWTRTACTTCTNRSPEYTRHQRRAISSADGEESQDEESVGGIARDLPDASDLGERVEGGRPEQELSDGGEGRTEQTCREALQPAVDGVGDPARQVHLRPEDLAQDVDEER